MSGPDIFNLILGVVVLGFSIFVFVDGEKKRKRRNNAS